MSELEALLKALSSYGFPPGLVVIILAVVAIIRYPQILEKIAGGRRKDETKELRWTPCKLHDGMINDIKAEFKAIRDEWKQHHEEQRSAVTGIHQRVDVIMEILAGRSK